MNYNRYVLETKLNNRKVLLNTVTKKVLPISCSKQDMKDNYFLKEQEDEVVAFHLKKKRSSLNLNLIPTWNCNLRCKHCVVLTKLDEKTNKSNLEHVFKFLDKYFEKEKTQKSLSIGIAGGETFLAIDFSLKILKIQDEIASKYGLETYSSVTTNGIFDFNEKEVEFIEKVDGIVVSLDGNKEEHNDQRKAYKKSIVDPFEKTISTIKKIVDMGYRNKLFVQAAIKDENYSIENYKNFLRTLLKIGVKNENITYGCIHPTNHDSNPQGNFIKDLKKVKPYPIPCCKYRFSSSLTIDTDGKIYDSYYTMDEGSCLGTLEDEPETIEKNSYKNILKTMPVLQDEKCKTCPVIGMCWGKCVNGGEQHLTPSKYCNQQGLIEYSKDLAEKGELIKVLGINV